MLVGPVGRATARKDHGTVRWGAMHPTAVSSPMGTVARDLVDPGARGGRRAVVQVVRMVGDSPRAGCVGVPVRGWAGGNFGHAWRAELRRYVSLRPQLMLSAHSGHLCALPCRYRHRNATDWSDGS